MAKSSSTKKSSGTTTKKSTKTSVGSAASDPGQSPATWPKIAIKIRSKPAKVERRKISPAPRIFLNSLKVLNDNRKLFIYISLIYGLFYLILVRGLISVSESAPVRANFQAAVHGSGRAALNGLGGLSSLLFGAGSSSNSNAGIYLSILVILTSLVIIWALRQVYAGNKVRVKESFYNGVFPLIPMLLIILLITVELIPFTIGGELFGLIISGGIAITVAEQVITGILCVGLMYISLYWLTSSIFALYIVTLPDMTPLKALRSARELVFYRRTIVFRKLIFLPLVIVIFTAVIILPLSLLANFLTPFIFLILTVFGLAIIHSYMYATYREMI